MNAPLPPNGIAIPTLPIADICRSLTNPRTHFDEKYLAELSASIKADGLHQPITVRPRPESNKAGAPAKYEIIMGECRYRACKLAGLTEIPAFWRDVDDRTALRMQWVENMKRRDLSEMEEAEGFQRMIRDFDYTPDSIATEIDQSKAYVYARLKLLALDKAGRDAFYAGELDASRALLIARIPAALQSKALNEILHGRHNSGEPMAYRTAKEHVQRNYMLLLAKAPFSRDDAKLVAKAGDCIKCPKRTGNQKDLFTDVKSADVCTDPTCYQAKAEAHAKIQIELAKERGAKVASVKEAKEIAPYGLNSSLQAGYVKLDDKNYDDPKHRTYREIMGKDAPAPVVVVDPRDSTRYVEALPKTTIAAHLKAKGKELPGVKRGKSDAEKAQDKKRKQTALFRQRLFDQVRSRLLVEIEDEAAEAPYLELEEEAMVAAAMFEGLGWDDRKRVAKLWMGPEGESQEESKMVHDFEARIAKLTRKNIARLLMDMTLVREAYMPSYSTAEPERLLAIAKPMAIDVAAMKAQIIAEDRAKGKKSTAKKAEPKVQPENAKPDGNGFKIGDHVRIANNLSGKGNHRRKCAGREGEIVSTSGNGAYYSVKYGPNSYDVAAGLVWNEISKLPETKTVPDATPAAQAKGGIAAKKAAPAKGTKPKGATAKKPKAKTNPAPASPANEPAKAIEGKSDESAAPVEKPPLLPWPFPTTSGPVAA